MLDAVRGWRKERELRTTDTSGRPVTVTTGLTTNAQGHLVVGLAIDDKLAAGPSAIIPVTLSGRLIDNLNASFDDHARKTGRRPR